MTKNRIRTIGLSALAATAAVVSLSTEALAAPPAPGRVRPPAGVNTLIVNYNSEKCLTIAGGGLGDNVYANQYRCDGHLARTWYLVDRGNYNFWIKNRNSGKCLTIAGGGYGDNIYANQYQCDGHPARLWYFVDRGNYNYHLVNYNSGKCLTIAGGGYDDNIMAVQYGCDPHPSRLWKFRY